MQLPVVQQAAQALPPLYSRWMEQLLPGPIPSETEATCEDCAMVADGESAAQSGGYYFDESTKCCTFIPELRNFIIGQILADDDPISAAGKATVEKRLDDGVELTPLGVGRGPTYRALYAHTAQVGGFGRTKHIKCPHYIDQTRACGIWKHREAVCSTWFCKHVRGATAQAFWRLLNQLLGYVETQVAQWCVVELDVGAEAFEKLFAGPVASSHVNPAREGQLDGRPDPEVYRQLWGNWHGRERQFFIECARLVEKLDWKDVMTLCSVQGKVLARLLRESHVRLLDDSLPDRLQVSSFELLRCSPDYSRVVSYSMTDPIELPRAVLDILHYFDGRPTHQAIQDIAHERGLQLDESLILRLVDFGILTAAK